MLLLGYGYLLLKGAQLLSDGSEMLLEVLDPGIIGTRSEPRLGVQRSCASMRTCAKAQPCRQVLMGNSADRGCALQEACSFLCWEPCQTASS